MTAHELLTMALRVLGFSVLISAVGETATLVAMISTPAEWSSTPVVKVSAVSALSYSVAAAVLLLYAPSVASWFYEKRGASGTLVSVSAIAPRDAYQFAARLLGISCLVSAIEPASRIVPELFGPRFWELLSSGTWPWAYLVETISYLLGGGFLMIKGPRIADLFARSHRTP